MALDPPPTVDIEEEEARVESQRAAGLDPNLLKQAESGDVLAIMSLGIQAFELTYNAAPNISALQHIATSMNIAYQNHQSGEVTLPDTSLETIELSLENIGYVDSSIVAGMGGRPPEVTVAAIEQPSTPATALTHDEIITHMWELQAHDQTVTIGTFEQGFTFLNPNYEEFFAAVENTGGLLVNSLKDQLEIAFNNDPETLQTFIDMADDNPRLATLTEVIGTEAGSTDIVLALSVANDMAPHSINPHAATPLPSVGPEIATIGEVITQEMVASGIDPTPNIDSPTDFSPQREAPTVLQTPAMPETLPIIDTTTPEYVAPPVIAEAEAPVTIVNTSPEITVEFNYISSVADANILLNGNAADDMDFLRNVVEEAREMGVDTSLITSIEEQIVTGDFVTTQASVAGVTSYAQELQEALSGDGIITNAEYGNALSKLFTEISGGIVVDRAGIADDIAAAPGTENAARQLMDKASSLAELSTPVAERLIAEAREAAERVVPAMTTHSL